MIKLTNLKKLEKQLEQGKTIQLHAPIAINELPGVFVVGVAVPVELDDLADSLKEVVVNSPDGQIPEGDQVGYWRDSFEKFAFQS